MILQRYTFGSKSQPLRGLWRLTLGCLWYCKDIHLEANHNKFEDEQGFNRLFMILQRYTFGSKSQLFASNTCQRVSCLWYCKDIHLEANHNLCNSTKPLKSVVYDIAKIYIWKQITTRKTESTFLSLLFMILQRYTFGSKSQRKYG